MKRMLFTVVVLLSGCASNSGVVPIGKDTFMVSRQAATGFSGSGTLKAEAFQEASIYCSGLGKTLQVISTHEASPPYILANFPKAEIQFMCLSNEDAELSRPKLKKVADSIIEIKSEVMSKNITPVSVNIYEDLLKLDHLRKENIITEAEFNEQKKILLSK